MHTRFGDTTLSRVTDTNTAPCHILPGLLGHAIAPSRSLLSSFALGILCLLCLSLPPTRAETPQITAVQSHSGQFTVRVRRSNALPPPPYVLAANPNLIRLDPSRLAVSCEHIKEELLRELGINASWQGKIYVEMYPIQTPDDPISITAQHFRDGWQYRLDLPDMVDRDRYVAGLVQVLLLEIANRKAGDNSAEVPLWLAEGLARQLLLSSNPAQLIPPPPNSGAVGFRFASTYQNAIRTNPLQQAYLQLTNRTPLTFNDLSWPSDNQLSHSAINIYRSSAQLLVASLLRFEDGRASLRNMLFRLPEFRNWQFAFLEAFHEHFQRLLEVEKWWALQTSQFTAENLSHIWPAAESWRKLDLIILSPAQVRTKDSVLVLPGFVTLQTIVRDWDRPRQEPALQSKINELRLLYLHISPDLMALTDDYRQALEKFLQNRYQSPPLVTHGQTPGPNPIISQTLKRLDELDARREALGRQLNPVSAKM